MSLLGSAFPLSFSKTQALLDQLQGVEISCASIATIHRALGAALDQRRYQAISFARKQPVAYVADEVLCAAVESGAPTGNADDSNPDEQRQLCWAHVTRDLTAIAERQGASGEMGAELLALQQQLMAIGIATKTEHSTGPHCNNPASCTDLGLLQRHPLLTRDCEDKRQMPTWRLETATPAIVKDSQQTD
jgi:hypothetical protein